MVEKLDPNRYHTVTPTQKRNLILIGILVILLVFPALTYVYYKFAIMRPAQLTKETTIEIQKGEGLFDIADVLYENDLLNSKYLFAFYVFANRVDKNIQAGIYTIPAGLSVVELVDLLQYGTNDVKLTFIEGWRVEEYALAASAALENVDYEDFVALAREYEGYLFPDTYFFNNEVALQDVVGRLKTTFDVKTKELLTEEVLAKVGLTRHEAVIFASIVEREVSDDSDRPVVAGILINRWKEGRKLDADSTTQYIATLVRAECDLTSIKVCPTDDYALENIWWPKDLSVTELSLDNPYNTRKVVGLPPSPISSVSISALEAVLNYTETAYDYYLTDINGITHYAETLEEHNNNVYKYLE